jgi:hypothetical protein
MFGWNRESEKMSAGCAIAFFVVLISTMITLIMMNNHL